MIIFILIMILLAVLYSTEAGRTLLFWIVSAPFKVAEYPFKIAHENRIKTEKQASVENIEEFKKSLTPEELTLIREEFFLPTYFQQIREQIALYDKFQRKKISNVYLKEEVLAWNRSLYLIKNEKIDALRRK